MQKINPPINCPSCNSILEWRKDVLYCVSPDCTSKALKSIQHWTKQLKIKGFGPKTIAKLNIDSVVELYSMTQESIEQALGSEKLASKLFLELENSKQASLDQILPAFGVPLIGNTASKKICSVITHIDELSESKAEEAGLGPKATENLLDWYYETYLFELKSNLPFTFKVEKKAIKVQAIKGVVCITGKLKSYKTKAEAQKVLELAGYIVKSSVTKDVTHLINESGVDSAKTVKARKSGINVVTEVTTLLGE